MSKHTIENVTEFHKTYKQTINEKSTIPSPEDRLLRIKLIAEEFIEYATASGYPIRVVMDIGKFEGDETINYDKITVAHDTGHIDIVEAADGLADLDYVVQGGNVTWGFPALEIADEVHASNMSKTDEKGNAIFREDGKVLKGPNYFKPNISAILDKHK